MTEITQSHREAAAKAMVRGYHDCEARWQRGPGRTCDCDDSRIDGCKARIEAIANEIASAALSAAGQCGGAEA